MSGAVVYLDGRFVAAEEARVSVFDHGFLYGDGLFETVRAYGGRLFRPEAHWDRLDAAARRIGLALPFDRAGFSALLSATLEHNREADALLRLTITRGEGPPVPDPSGCGAPTVVVTCRPAPVPAPEAWRRGLSVVLVRETAACGAGNGLKSLSFLGHVLALAEARSRGADEALRVNPGGEVAEGSVSNLFGVWHGVLATPPLAAGALPGVTRGLVLDLARRAGIPTTEQALAPEALEGAAELFVTSSGREVAPVTRLEGKRVGSGTPGPVTEKLHAAFRRAVEAECGGAMARSACG